MTELGKRIKIPAVVGSHSLIGVGGLPPHPWGNYFWFHDKDKPREENPRCLNMWAENLEVAVKKFLDDGLVEVILYNDSENDNDRFYAIVDDNRIPDGYYYNKLCFTGGYPPSKEIAKEIYDYLGDPDYEYERFIDTKTYYEKRGWLYDEKSGTISKCFK